MFGFIIGFMRKIMKAAHFILNTDYVTSQNDAETTITVALPSSFYVPANTLQEYKATATIAGSASKDYRCYITSSAFSYAITGLCQGSLQFGNDTLTIDVRRSKDTFTLSVWPPKELSAKTYSGTGQVITAHIQTFVDPFQV